MSVISSRMAVCTVLFALGIVIIGLLLVPGCGLTAAPEIGYRAPDFTLNDLDGNIVRLSDFRGKVVFLNFWAVECPACRVEMPAMEELYQAYQDKDVVIIGVDLWESRGSVKSFVVENGYSWTFVIDSTGQVTMDYLIIGIPTSFFIDEDGVIRALQVGAMSMATMEAKLAEAME